MCSEMLFTCKYQALAPACGRTPPNMISPKGTWLHLVVGAHASPVSEPASLHLEQRICTLRELIRLTPMSMLYLLLYFD
jgi:hypothetical protein